jgi:hypothetical protein
MKQFIKTATYSLFAGSILIFSCKKENTTSTVNNSSTQSNRAPIANAGPDKTVNILSCYAGRTVELDASASSDPGNNGLLEFAWTKISGPFCIISSLGTNSPKAEVTQLNAGQYVFELTVTSDATASSKGLSSRDTMRITVTGIPSPDEYDLDVNFNNDFQFLHNASYCYDFMGVPVCLFYDLTTMRGSFNVHTLGEMIFSTYETDTTSGTNTEMSLSCAGCAPSKFIGGVSSINFRQLMRQGGGAFSGTWSIQTGSARNNCDSHVFDTAEPLAISGRMDTAARTINLTIKGKVFF